MLEEVGGFREDLFPCEDLELDRRLVLGDKRLVFVADAQVFHYRPDSLFAFARMNRRYGAAHRKLVSIHGPFRLLHALPWAVPLGLAALGGTLVVAPPAGATLTGLLLAVVLGSLAVRGGLANLPGNAGLLKVALAAWLAGYYTGA